MVFASKAVATVGMWAAIGYSIGHSGDVAHIVAFWGSILGMAATAAIWFSPNE